MAGMRLDRPHPAIPSQHPGSAQAGGRPSSQQHRADHVSADPGPLDEASPREPGGAATSTVVAEGEWLAVSTEEAMKHRAEAAAKASLSWADIIALDLTADLPDGLDPTFLS